MTLRTTPGSGYAGTYVTNTDVMNAAANHVTETGQTMTSVVGSLMTQLGDLPSAWVGPAGTAFHGPNGAQQHWQDKHSELIDACNAIAGALQSSAQGYLNTEEDSTTAVRNVIPL